MRAITILLAVLTLSSAAFAAEKRPRIEQDDCARRSADCERDCDLQEGMDRLSCKTDCRMAESECRNARR